jgi:hypothetical protein
MSFRLTDIPEKPIETPSENRKMVSYKDTPFSDLFSDEEMVSFTMGSRRVFGNRKHRKIFVHFPIEGTVPMKFGEVIGPSHPTEYKEEQDRTQPPTKPPRTGPSPGTVQTIIDTWRRRTGINLTYDHIYNHLEALRAWHKRRAKS